jgi:uncharacterized protein (DUF58 family)
LAGDHVVMPVPTRRLALVAAIAAGVRLLLPAGLPGGLWLVNGVLLVIAMGDWLLAPRPASLEVGRTFPAVVALHGEAELAWTVANRSGRRVVAHVADELAPSLHAGRRRFRVELPARGTATVRTTLRPSRRGRFHPTEVTVRTEGPLGLAARQDRRQVPSLLRVHPPFRSRKEAELRIERARILEIGLRSARGRGGGTDFDQLREYTPDDDHRRIDWAATARSQRVIVKTFRAERNQTLVLLLDNGRVMAGQVGGVPRVEHAMDAVLCVTTVATRLGDKCGLVAYDRQVRAVVTPSSTRAQVGRVTDAMYDLEPELVESDHRGAFTAVLARFRRRSMLIILSDLVEQVIGESLLPVLPIVSRRHLVVVAAVSDPDVVSWAEGAAPDAEAAYRKASAVASLQARARAAASLEALGAIVVDAPPGLLAARLTDAYLEAKATGRL